MDYIKLEENFCLQQHLWLVCKIGYMQTVYISDISEGAKVTYLILTNVLRCSYYSQLPVDDRVWVLVHLQSQSNVKTQKYTRAEVIVQMHPPQTHP